MSCVRVLPRRVLDGSLNRPSQGYQRDLPGVNPMTLMTAWEKGLGTVLMDQVGQIGTGEALCFLSSTRGSPLKQPGVPRSYHIKYGR